MNVTYEVKTAVRGTLLQVQGRDRTHWVAEQPSGHNHQAYSQRSASALDDVRGCYKKDVYEIL